MTLLALAAMTSTPEPPILPDLPPTSLIHSTGHLVLDWANANRLADISDVTDATSLREQDDIIYDPADENPDRRWKFYFSVATPDSRDGGGGIWLIASHDRQTWSAPIQCTAGGSPIVGEDPSICQTLTTTPHAHRDNGRLVMYAENTSSTINVYSSSDGIAWTLDSTSVITIGPVDSWERRLVGSPCARHDGEQYIVAYEGVATGNIVQSTGIAHGTSRTTLTKSEDNPVHTAAGYGFTSPNESAFIDSMWLTPEGDRIMVTGHAGYNGAVTMFRAYTTNLDPLTWEPGDFTLIGMVDPVRNDLTCDWWGDRLVTAPADDLSIVALPLKVP